MMSISTCFPCRSQGRRPCRPSVENALDVFRLGSYITSLPAPKTPTFSGSVTTVLAGIGFVQSVRETRAASSAIDESLRVGDVEGQQKAKFRFFSGVFSVWTSSMYVGSIAASVAKASAAADLLGAISSAGFAIGGALSVGFSLFGARQCHTFLSDLKSAEERGGGFAFLQNAIRDEKGFKRRVSTRVYNAIRNPAGSDASNPTTRAAREQIVAQARTDAKIKRISWMIGALAGLIALGASCLALASGWGFVPLVLFLSSTGLSLLNSLGSWLALSRKLDT